MGSYGYTDCAGWRCASQTVLSVGSAIFHPASLHIDDTYIGTAVYSTGKQPPPIKQKKVLLEGRGGRLPRGGWD